MSFGVLDGILGCWRITVKAATYSAVTAIAYGMYLFVGTDVAHDVEQSELRRQADRGSAAPASGAFPAAGASIFIPKIDAQSYLVRGAEVEVLRRGPGVLAGSADPGEFGNLVIAGHRTTWGAPFARLGELVIGDRITIRAPGGEWEYRVIPPPGAGLSESTLAHHIVTPDQVQVAEQLAGVSRLTLITCHPRWSAQQRMVVVAELHGKPRAMVPRSTPSVKDAANATAMRLDQLGLDAPKRSLAWALGPGAVAWGTWAVLTAGIRRSRMPWAAVRCVIAAMAAVGPLLVLFTRLDEVLW
ncbi:MAG: class E sortase [Angustibacter sp.]